MNQPNLLEVPQKFTEVWMCGGGTQSCAIAVLILQGKLPKPDFAIIADTGFERQQTWDYYGKFLYPELKAIGVNLQRVKRTEFAANWANGVFATSGHLLVPAFTDESGKVGKLDNFCSKAWKTEVCERYLRVVHGIRLFRKWMGFSFDEQTRWAKYEADREIFLPLVHGFPMVRQASIKVVLDYGWDEPPRSNCWMCANMSDDEWLDMKENTPEEFAKAVQFEKEIQMKDPNAWLHKSCIPLDQVEFKRGAGKARQCDSGHCFV